MQRTVFLMLGLALGLVMRPARALCSTPNPQLDQQLVATLDLGEPPLSSFDLNRFKQLIAQGASVNAQNVSGESVLLLATIDHAYLDENAPEAQKFFTAMKILIAGGADINLTDNLGTTPLMMAVHRALCCITDGHPVPHLKPVYDLLLSGAHQPDLEIKNYLGDTALAYLAKWNQTDEVKRFISLGANLYTQDNDGNTIFGVAAASSEKPTLFDSLIQLVPAARQHAVASQVNFSGSTPLMAATRSADAELVTELIESYGVDPNASNAVGESALSIADEYANLPRQPKAEAATYRQIAQFLTSHGATPPAPPSQTIQCHGPNPEPWDFNKVTATILVCGIKSLDQLIPLFPVSYLSNYVLSYAARGIQQGTFSAPRVIAIGSDGSNMYAFNGDPGERGYNSLEMVNVQPDAKFVYREISFENGKAVFSNPNPAVCLRCHGANPRPRWDNWYLWPGFYDSEQGVMYPIEGAYYENDFLPNSHKGRYQFLRAPSDSPWINSLGLVIPPGTVKTVKMDLVLDDLNSNEIVSELVSNPVLQKFKYAILGALSCPNRPEEYLPAPIVAQMPRDYDSLLKENQTLDLEEFKSRIARDRQLLGSELPQGSYGRDFINGVQKTGQSYQTIRLARLRYLVEGLGQSMDWSNTFEASEHYVVLGIPYLEAKLWKEWLSPSNPNETALWNLYSTQYNRLPVDAGQINGLFWGNDPQPAEPGADSKPLCDLLVKKSLAVLSRAENRR